MPELKNLTKEKLAKGELALGVGLRQARSVDIGKAMKTAGFDWLFIDMQHNAMDIDIATQIAVAGQDAGITPIVRVPGFEHHLAARALDGGAQGIVFPHVDDAETAARLELQRAREAYGPQSPRERTALKKPRHTRVAASANPVGGAATRAGHRGPPAAAPR